MACIQLKICHVPALTGQGEYDIMNDRNVYPERMRNMAKITWKGSALLAPVPPVMVTCGDMENSNIITVGWTGIINTHPPRVSIAVRPTRHSYQIIKDSGEFVIHLTPARLVRECDYCGIFTGAKVDKFAKFSLTPIASENVAPPTIKESPLALECRVFDVISMGTHDVFMADIISVSADEEYFDENDKLRLDKAGLMAYSHGEYYALGRKLGKFGFSTAKKKSKGAKRK